MEDNYPRDSRVLLDTKAATVGLDSLCNVYTGNHMVVSLIYDILHVSLTS